MLLFVYELFVSEVWPKLFECQYESEHSCFNGLFLKTKRKLFTYYLLFVSEVWPKLFECQYESEHSCFNGLFLKTKRKLFTSRNDQTVTSSCNICTLFNKPILRILKLIR